ncbi:type IX secretion system outer membrane channel protein PorV [Flavobacterium amniphilum]|uniref:type IX secretion system outer membrane channel protein PorV n=1 Tax=Flavobacterium amniphilum TaxID=1834035 RepID=UPI00202A8971|nr:type IX secretion system outer membrane channel protein PorV [Flavobacterium amniphilum]MCL9807495.1 type IX secretion system outer membrane channel protein PorV [Flavobacterium amniphilum]
MKKLILLFTGLLASSNTFAQNERPITTGVPFLLIAADARSAGMGDNGVATSPDAFSQQFNPAKYAFSLKKSGFSVSYTPYLTDLVNDISLSQITYFNRFNERSAFGGSLRYFGLGDIELTDQNGNSTGSVKPNELAFDLSYSLQLSDKFSMGVAGRYIRSNLKIASSSGDASAANSFAVDVAGYYESSEIAYNDFNGRWRAGFNLQNMGPKISYDGDVERSSNFLPANLRLGGGFDFIFDEYNKVTANLEFTKLLVPTPQIVTDANGDGFIDGPEYQAAADEYNKVGWVSGMFKSFGDAPDGFKEELKELTYSTGLEYWYQDSFALRAGYFNESKDKGARKFATLGAGFKYNAIKIDASYLFSMSRVKNPLENTLRFSLTFNFGDDYDQY